jgi:hypothetical protein
MANTPDSPPQIDSLHFPTVEREDCFVVEFAIVNPTSQRLALHQAHLGYWDRDPVLMFINTWAPDDIYPLALHVNSIASSNALEPLTGVIKEVREPWEGPISGALVMGSGQVSVDFSFPLALEIDAMAQKTMRVITTNFHWLPGAPADDFKLRRVVMGMDKIFSHYRYGYFTLALEGDRETPLEAQVVDPRLWAFVARMSTQGLAKD